MLQINPLSQRHKLRRLRDGLVLFYQLTRCSNAAPESYVILSLLNRTEYEVNLNIDFADCVNLRLLENSNSCIDKTFKRKESNEYQSVAKLEVVCKEKEFSLQYALDCSLISQRVQFLDSNTKLTITKKSNVSKKIFQVIYSVENLREDSDVALSLDFAGSSNIKIQNISTLDEEYCQNVYRFDEKILALVPQLAEEIVAVVNRTFPEETWKLNCYFNRYKDINLFDLPLEFYSQKTLRCLNKFVIVFYRHITADRILIQAINFSNRKTFKLRFDIGQCTNLYIEDNTYQINEASSLKIYRKFKTITLGPKKRRNLCKLSVIDVSIESNFNPKFSCNLIHSELAVNTEAESTSRAKDLSSPVSNASSASIESEQSQIFFRNEFAADGLRIFSVASENKANSWIYYADFSETLVPKLVSVQLDFGKSQNILIQSSAKRLECNSIGYLKIAGERGITPPLCTVTPKSKDEEWKLVCDYSWKSS